MISLPIFKNTPFNALYRNTSSSFDTTDETSPDPNLNPTQNSNIPSRKQKIIYDVIGLLVIYTLIFIFYMILNPPSIYFRIDDTTIMYPFRPSHVPSVLVALLSILLPIGVIIAFHVFFAWYIWDLLAGLYGALLAYTLSLLFTSVLWYFVGGLRPHFLHICQPDTRLSEPFMDIYYTIDVCSNKNSFTRDTFHGFPSGHASTSFAGCVYLSAYLAAHLKIYRNGNIFKVLIVMLPLIVSIWMAVSRIADHHHTPIQVFAGIIIGIFSAFYAYRLTYVSGFWLGYGKNSYIPFLHYGNP